MLFQDGKTKIVPGPLVLSCCVVKHTRRSGQRCVYYVYPVEPLLSLWVEAEPPPGKITIS